MSKDASNFNSSKTPIKPFKNKTSLADILTSIAVGAILLALLLLFIWVFVELDVFGIILIILFFIFV